MPHDQPFLQLPDGRYDLTQPDPVFWDRLERLLDLAEARGMIVELEVFNRFDFWRGFWRASAWNPANNINYSAADTGLADDYRDHPTEDRHPFFHAVPAMADNPVLLAFQTAYVNRLLDLTLRYDIVLYCINNETSTDPAWGRHWADHIRDRAAASGQGVFVTDMFEAHDLAGDPFQRALVADAATYGHVNAAQVTSMRNSGAEQRAQLAWLRSELAENPRPVNLSKIYGADTHRLTDFRRRTFQRHGDLAAVNSFWSSLFSGVAAARFHRADAGLGPSDRAFAAIRAARLMEDLVAPWEMEPADTLLSGNGDITIPAGQTALGRPFVLSEAQAMARPGESYAVYFTQGGSVGLTLEDDAVHDLAWIDIDRGAPGPTGRICCGGEITLTPPGDGGWIAVLRRDGAGSENASLTLDAPRRPGQGQAAAISSQ